MADDSPQHPGGTNSENVLPSLPDADVHLLRFEEQWPREVPGREMARRRLLGMSQARYLQRLVVLVTDPRAVEMFPQVCARVVRRQERAAADRAERRVRSF